MLFRSPPPNIYDIPYPIQKVYDKVNADMDKMPFQIESCYTLLDLLMVLFPDGIDTMIAVDSEGLIEGGVDITSNDVQMTFIQVCQTLLPPAQPIYEIKDECLGTFHKDKNKDDAINKLEIQIVRYKKLLDSYKDSNNACNNWVAVQNYSIQIYQRIGEYVGHIPDYIDKIENIEMDDFTISKIISITALYKNLNDYMEGNC